MKRFLCLLVAIAMLCSLTACKSSKNDNALQPLTPVGTYEPGDENFYEIQSDLYDYFLGFLGFGHITKSDANGNFSDDEMLQLALIQLSYAGEDLEAGLTKRQIDRTTTRFFGEKVNKLEGNYLTYDKDKELYFPKNVSFTNGQYLILKTLTVQEDATCIAEFDRIFPAKASFPADRSEGDIKNDLLNGVYDGIGGDRIRMTYHERETKAYGYYIEILSIEFLGFIN